MELRKRFKNESGDIIIYPSNQGSWIVEMLHLWNNNDSGCTIGVWEKRKLDGEYEGVFKSIGDRLVTTTYDEPSILLNALKYGQKLADLIIESTEE